MFYVLDDNNNKVEGLDKQGVVALLNKAIEDGTLAGIASDSAFVDKLKCCVSGNTFKVAFVTQAKYNELKAEEQLITNCYYFVTDDTTCEDIDEQLSKVNACAAAIENQNIRLTALENKAAEIEEISFEQIDPIAFNTGTKLLTLTSSIPEGTVIELFCTLRRNTISTMYLYGKFKLLQESGSKPAVIANIHCHSSNDEFFGISVTRVSATSLQIFPMYKNLTDDEIKKWDIKIDKIYKMNY